MMELGRHSVEEHRKIGETVAEAADIFFAVGPRMKAAGEIARGKRLKTIETFSDSREAGDALRKILKAGDVVLVKGSQSTRMERVVEIMMAEPERRKELFGETGRGVAEALEIFTPAEVSNCDPKNWVSELVRDCLLIKESISDLQRES